MPEHPQTRAKLLRKGGDPQTAEPASSQPLHKPLQWGANNSQHKNSEQSISMDPHERQAFGTATSAETANNCQKLSTVCQGETLR